MAKGRSSILAGFLSIIPGLGQLYKGSILWGIVWFIVVCGSYTFASWIWLFYPIAAVIHLVCIIHAVMMRER